MKAVGEMTAAELAAFVQSHLRTRGIEVILSGGAAVAIYSRGRYVSGDLDLVNARFTKRSAIREAMQEIGFREVGRHFEHPETDLFVEFPAGPLSVGEEPIGKVDEIELATGTLRLISPLDCVKDRLMAYYFWSDQQCLYQASLVVQERHVDLNKLRRWSETIGEADEFERIEAKLRGKTS